MLALFNGWQSNNSIHFYYRHYFDYSLFINNILVLQKNEQTRKGL